MFRLLRTFVLCCLLLGGLALLGACGTANGSSGSGNSSANKGNVFSTETVAQQVAVAADPSGALKWDRSSYEAKAGDISFVVKNASPQPHQFAIEGNGVNYQSANFQANTTHVFTVKNLPAGEYQIVCNYPGHKAAGMVAKLVVR